MKNLKKLREQHNLTQREMADILGIQRPTYTRYETEERQPDFDLVIKIAQYFDVSVDYLLGKSENMNLDEQLEGLDFALYGEVKELTDAQKQDIIDYARFKKVQWGKHDGTKNE